QTAALEQGIPRVVEHVPADLWHPGGIDPGCATGEYAEPVALPFIAPVAEQLHAEADAEAGQSLLHGASHNVQPRREAWGGGAEGSNAGQYQHTRLDRAQWVGLESHRVAGESQCLLE